MMPTGLYFYEESIKDAGEVVTYDEARMAAFVKGVKWTLDSLERAVYDSHHPMASPSDNAYLDKLTLRDIKAFIKKMKTQMPESRIEPQEKK